MVSLSIVSPQPLDFSVLYASFQAPVASINCGERCSPYNEQDSPFCCDTRHAVPTAYQVEWEFLQAHTDLWHLWKPESVSEWENLHQRTPSGHVLIECQGHRFCQRNFRSITCRAFPFFPYLTRLGEFIGLSYYWEYQEYCWIISNLALVSDEYRQEFITCFEYLFAQMPAEKDNFRYHSEVVRRIFGRWHRAIPLLHRNGHVYKITPRNGRLRRIEDGKLPMFGSYRVAAEMKFPDEL